MNPQAQQPDLLKRRLMTMIDSFGRMNQFLYTHPLYSNGVHRIVDFSGRVMEYDYNADGQLLSVRSPPVTPISTIRMR